MRALVSLYHQAETFISLDNLSEAIDTAFIEKPKDRKSREMSYDRICTLLRSRSRRPKVSAGRARSMANDAEDPTTATARMWSEQEHQREYKVRAALFGTEGMGKPGLGVLEDEYERVVEDLRKDRRAEREARGPQ